MTKTTSKMWHLVTIEDAAGLPGKSICDMIKLFLQAITFNFIIIDDIYGAAEAVAVLEKQEGVVLQINDFLQIAEMVIQFDWGDFFLFTENPIEWKNSKNVLYPSIIAQTSTTIRAIDDTYIYIYTPHQELVDLIAKNYKIESTKFDYLENLDYPE